MDPLAAVFRHFSLSAKVFFCGKLCGISGNHDTDNSGHLHLLREGCIDVIQPDKQRFRIREPSVLFYPRPMQHRFQTDAEGAEIVCARIDFGAGVLQPLLQSLPSFIHISLTSARGLGRGVELLFEEAFGDLPGRQAAVDRLAEYVLILLLRDAVGRKLVQSGTLRGLSDERLSKALMTMHQNPERPWDLDRLADVAGMSRARFAAHFREVVGATPMAYLTAWRMAIVQVMLRRGEPLKSIAPAVGYESSTALSRIFTRLTGQSPTEWIASSRFDGNDL
jgi:AraC-like DNA-binding protein